MFNIDHFQDLLAAETPRAFLNVMEEYFRSKNISRYMYIFLPTGTRGDSEFIEYHQYGYENMPDVLENVRKFILSTVGSKHLKSAASAMLLPFDPGSDFVQGAMAKADGIIMPEVETSEVHLGISVQAGGYHSGLFFFRGDKEASCFNDNARATQVMCQLFHQRYCELWLQPSFLDVQFTPREREIINWMAQGKSNAVIGDIVGLSKHTVDGCLRFVFRKLAVANRTAAAVRASELGLLQF